MSFESPNQEPSQDDMQKLAAEGEVILKEEGGIEPSDDHLNIEALKGDDALLFDKVAKAKTDEATANEIMKDLSEPGGIGEQHFAANSAQEMIEQLEGASGKKWTEEAKERFISNMINDARKRKTP